MNIDKLDPITGLPRPTQILEMLLALREEISSAADAQYEHWRLLIRDDREDFCKSAHNLAAYLSFRQYELRQMQDWLAALGLSSLGRTESRVLATLDAVIATLDALKGTKHDERVTPRPTLEQFNEGRVLLEHETMRVFGAHPKHRRVRMMVTMPTEAARDYNMVLDMAKAGMNIARINCAHDDWKTWADMIMNIRAAESATGQRIHIAMDLAGPKVRTADVIIPPKYRITRGDKILLCRDATQKSKGYPIQVRCTLTNALDHLTVGAKVYFDDGKLGTVVREVNETGALLEVTSARAKGVRLKDDKGINFPGTQLDLTPLTPKDLIDLDFAVSNADIINYSFVRTPDDVRLLQREIDQRNNEGRLIALVLKIETAEAIHNLPDLIIEAGGVQPVGVMIARGDLALEIGWERLAEMQEEILWVCEAAHVPVIWATQVLEGLAKEGIPSRAEITDAAMSERAECVMLNKGAHILDAMHILDSVLERMGAHQSKKTPRLRALKSWKMTSTRKKKS